VDISALYTRSRHPSTERRLDTANAGAEEVRLTASKLRGNFPVAALVLANEYIVLVIVVHDTLVGCQRRIAEVRAKGRLLRKINGIRSVEHHTQGTLLIGRDLGAQLCDVNVDVATINHWATR
jgi:hypothetical protein